MRKLISKVSVLLVVLLLVSVMSTTAFAAGGTDYVRASAKTVGDDVTLTLTAVHATTDGKLSLTYDASVLQYEGIEIGSAVSSVDSETAGTVRFGYACLDSETIGRGGVIATVHFTVLNRSSVVSKVEIAVSEFNAHEALDGVVVKAYVPLVDSGLVNAGPGFGSDSGSDDDTGSGSEGGSGLGFTDVSRTDWFYDAVAFVVENGYFNGTSATTFSPDSPMTRAMFVTVLGRLAGVDVDNNATGGFTDVKAGSYYAGYVAWAAENGIVNGTSATTFSPDGLVTREQMAAFLYRYAKYQGMDVTASSDALDAFSDADAVSGWAREAMAWATDRQIINGTGHGVAPQATATRAQVAQIILNFSQYAQ